MIALLLDTLGGYTAWALAGLVAFVAAVISWKRSVAVAAKNKGLRDYAETRKAADDAETMDDPTSAAEWLRNRNPDKR